MLSVSLQEVCGPLLIKVSSCLLDRFLFFKVFRGVCKMSVKSILEDIKKLTVVELADLVSAIEEEFGVSAAAQATVVSSPAATSSDAGTGQQQQEDKSEYKVTLKDAGSQKIKVIKVLRAAISGLGLKEAKEMVDGAPQTVSESMPKKEAQELKKALEEAGASVELS